MPELPEVETVCRQLAAVIVGETIFSAKIVDEKLRKSGVGQLKGHRITEVSRCGKEIVIAFGEELFLEVHLRMTGQLIWYPKGGSLNSGLSLYHKHSPSPKALRVTLHTKKGELRFYDTRRFGTLKLTHQAPTLNAVDPVNDRLTGSRLLELIKGSTQQIKVWLLRQDRLVGIGNIYASEILFDAGISPLRKASSLSTPEVTKLARSIVKILKLAIRKSGTTFSDYRDAKGEAGGFQNLLKVYDRTGERCKKCRSEEILRTVQGQRSTFWCPNCQR